MFISLIRQLEAALLPDWGTGGLGDWDQDLNSDQDWDWDLDLDQD